MIGDVGVTTAEFVSYLPLTYFLYFSFLLFFNFLYQPIFIFRFDMSDIRRYIRYSPVFWAVWNKGVSVPVDRPIQCEIDSPAYSNNVLD